MKCLFPAIPMVHSAPVCLCLVPYQNSLPPLCTVHQSESLRVSTGDIRLVHAAGEGLYRGPHRHICCCAPSGRNGGPDAAGSPVPHLEGRAAHHHLHSHHGSLFVYFFFFNSVAKKPCLDELKKHLEALCLYLFLISVFVLTV